MVNINSIKPEPLTEVLVLVNGKRNSSWSNNYFVVAFMDNNGYFWEERHRSEYPLDVILWCDLPERI